MDTIVQAAPNLNCAWWDGTCNMMQTGLEVNESVSDAIANGTDNLATSALSGIATGWMVSWQKFELNFLSSWINLPPVTDLNDPNGTTIWLIAVLSYLTAVAAIIGILVNSVYLMITLRGDRARKLGLSLMWMLILNNAGPAIAAAIELGIHAMASDVLRQADITAGAAVTEAAVIANMPGVYLIAAIIGTIGVFIQYGIMFARGSLMPLFVGVLPLAAAIATIGGKATSSFEKIIGWGLAFVVYPLPAAIVYVTAFRLKSGYDGVNGAIAGMILQVIAIFALPAIFRIIAPSTATLGKAYGGRIALDAAITVAETAAAIGAMVVTAGVVGGAMGGGKAAGKPSPAANTSTGPAGGGPTGESGSTDGGGSPNPAPPSGASTSSDAGSAPGSAAPSGAASTGPAAPSGAASTGPAETREPAAPTGATKARTPESSANNTHRAYAAQQAAHHISSAAGRAARQGVDDVDEIIGGKA
ncbi:hypothetical protein ACPPVW_18575 [Leifsonia sp. McL0607]|uniref:hypothetical protein n=1 Tax=Leifsonia sp. McL0607 TaxID=3415672 RepID=UPI003CE6D9FD